MIIGATINSAEVTNASDDDAQAAVDVTFDDSSGTSSFYLGWNLILEDGVWKLDAITVGGETG